MYLFIRTADCVKRIISGKHMQGYKASAATEMVLVKDGFKVVLWQSEPSPKAIYSRIADQVRIAIIGFANQAEKTKKKIKRKTRRASPQVWQPHCSRHACKL